MDWTYPALSLGLRAGDAVLPANFPRVPEAGALIEAAGTAPDAAAREGLARLLAAIAADTRLTFFGRLSLRWDMLRLLRNAGLVAAAHRDNPALGAPVPAPVFILGLPRSGTTFLHALMAEDDENAVPRNWQTIYPAPRPKNFNPAKDSRATMVDRQLKIFAGLSPAFHDLHPASADSPQECSEITAHVFQSLRFDTTFRVPGYLAWLEALGHAGAFTFHKTFLQYLQAGAPQRWVLKCPDHVFTIEAILATYPDARFVIVHRDPLAVLGSVAHLTEVLRKPFMKNIGRAEIAAQVGERWIHGANLLLEFDQRRDIAASRKIHVHHDDLVAAPLAEIRRIYAQLDMELRPEAVAAMEGYITARPHGGYARHAPYPMDAFKMGVESLKAQFAPYVSQYCRGSS